MLLRIGRRTTTWSLTGIAVLFVLVSVIAFYAMSRRYRSNLQDMQSRLDTISGKYEMARNLIAKQTTDVYRLRNTVVQRDAELSEQRNRQLRDV